MMFHVQEKKLRVNLFVGKQKDKINYYNSLFHI